ncbi:hypothetical protein E1301_Tti020688 [Triplophysa tibetana]|uniref:Uncharacterized protein n=1 Tax=Triplophysa tibetana TaxID=1572043 RepID=A0A5A9N566_9TELE|nr:hypothetical protein E1301_Tti020688 [Triplophysa tibetana]
MDREETFKKLVRVLFRFLKTKHHLAETERDPGPRSLNRAATWLEQLVRPAQPTEGTTQMLWGNARNWLGTSRQILADHYEETLRGLHRELSTLDLSEAERAWEVAKRWLRRNLPHAREGVVQRAEAEMRALVVARRGPAEAGGTGMEVTTAGESEAEAAQRERLRQELKEELRQELRAEIVDQVRSEAETGMAVQEPQTSDARTRRDPKKTEEELDWEALLSDSWEEWDGEPGEKRKGDNELPGPSKRGSNNKSAEGLPDDRGKPEGVAVQIGGPRQSLHMTIDHQGNKKARWVLNPMRPILILGDSNVGRITDLGDNHIQLVSYPGAQWSNILWMLQHHTPTSPDTQVVIIVVGINDRGTRACLSLRKMVMGTLAAAEKRFPNARVRAPVINFSAGLPKAQRDILRSLNNYILETGASLPPLPGSQFRVERDLTHWTSETAMAMAKLWLDALNYGGAHQHQADGTVVNLSKLIQLSKGELSLLQKGLTFIPSTRVSEFNMPELQVQASSYHRRLRLAAFFGVETEDRQPELPFKPPSEWEPPPDQVPRMAWDIIKQDNLFLSSLPGRHTVPTGNLSRGEEEALDRLCATIVKRDTLTPSQRTAFEYRAL